MRDYAEVKLEVLARLDMRAVAELCGVELRKAGQGRWSCCCPFHTEKSPSFVVGGNKDAQHRGHCFGCGWDGDFFAFWQELKGCDFKQALTDLAGVAGVSLGDGMKFHKVDAPRVRQPERRPASERPEFVKPSLPSLRHLREEECAQIAKTRGLDKEAIWMAAREFKRAAFSMWPLYQTRGEWLPRSAGAHPSWCAIDHTRNTAEFRRLDNAKYVRQDGGEIKTWSTRGKAWPLGAAAMNGRPAVMLVEGGPDMLAAYHFLRRFRMVQTVAVVCMLGASNRIREDALPFFKGKRVRIMVDADLPKDDPNPAKRKMPGLEAARRWGAQLAEAGAAVTTFYPGPIFDPEQVREWSAGTRSAADIEVREEGLRLPDGELVKDLNDLAKCGRDVLESQDLRRAFLHWDF